MRTAERLVLYPAALIALVLGLASYAPDRAARATEDPKGATIEHKIAVCDIIRVVELLMESERYSPARDDMLRAAEQDIAPLRERLEQAQRQAQNTPQDDPLYRDIVRNFQRAQQEYQQRAQELMREQEALATRQLVECYGMAKGATETVAEQHGYTLVLQSRMKDIDDEAADVQSVVRAMLARPVAVNPEAVDITPDVMFELRLN